MRSVVAVKLAMALRAEGMAWRDVVQEIAWATGRRFTHDGMAAACYRARSRGTIIAEENGDD
jgi:hypothetical protein